MIQSAFKLDSYESGFIIDDFDKRVNILFLGINGAVGRLYVPSREIYSLPSKIVDGYKTADELLSVSSLPDHPFFETVVETELFDSEIESSFVVNGFKNPFNGKIGVGVEIIVPVQNFRFAYQAPLESVAHEFFETTFAFFAEHTKTLLN